MSCVDPLKPPRKADLGLDEVYDHVRPQRADLRSLIDARLPSPMSDEQWAFAQEALTEMFLADREFIEIMKNSR